MPTPHPTGRNLKVHQTLVSLCLLSALAAPGVAQDSVPNKDVVCLPGDGLRPHDTAEQRNSFVVDLDKGEKAIQSVHAAFID